MHSLFFIENQTHELFEIAFFCLVCRKGGSGEVVTSPPLNRKVGCSRPTRIRARYSRVRQHYPAQKNNQKNASSS